MNRLMIGIGCNLQVRFGPFLLDSESQELLRDSSPCVAVTQGVRFCCASWSRAGRRRSGNASCRSGCGPLIRGGEEPRQPGERNSRCHRRSLLRSAIDSDCAPIWLRVTQNGPRIKTGDRGDVAESLSGSRGSAGRVTLDQGERAVGRDPNVEIYLDAPGVSRRHAQIKIAAARATIEDVGSKNGTFVGNQRVDGCRSVADGDVITVGSMKLTVRALQAPTSTETERH